MTLLLLLCHLFLFFHYVDLIFFSSNRKVKKKYIYIYIYIYSTLKATCADQGAAQPKHQKKINPPKVLGHLNLKIIKY